MSNDQKIWAINRISQLVKCFEFKLLIMITFSSVFILLKMDWIALNPLIGRSCMSSHALSDWYNIVQWDLEWHIICLLSFPLLIMFTEITDDSQVEKHGGVYMCVKMITFVLKYKYWATNWEFFKNKNSLLSVFLLQND